MSNYATQGAYHWRLFEKNGIYKKHAEHLASIVGAGKTLEIGAGDGRITALLNAVGVDEDETAVRLAEENGANVDLGNYSKLAQKASSVSNVLIDSHIETMQKPENVLKEARRVLKPGGQLIIVTIAAPDKKLITASGFKAVGKPDVRKDWVRTYSVYESTKAAPGKRKVQDALKAGKVSKSTAKKAVAKAKK